MSHVAPLRYLAVAQRPEMIDLAEPRSLGRSMGDFFHRPRNRLVRAPITTQTTSEGTMLGQQLFCRLRDEGAVFPNDTCTKRTVAAAVLGRDNRFGLLAFRVAGSCLRAVVVGQHGDELARRIEIALARRDRSWGPFERARVTPILDQWHLDNAVRRLLRQAGSDPADPLAEGSNLPDLLGLRVIGRHTHGAIRQALPRIQRHDLLGGLGLGRLEPATGPVELLPDAAAAAVGLPVIASRSDAGRAAIRAAIEVGARANLSAVQIGELLRVHRVTVSRRRGEPADPDLVRAVALQLGLRRARLDQQLSPAAP